MNPSDLVPDRDILMYIKKAGGFPEYLVAINFGNKRMIGSSYEATGISLHVFHSHNQGNAAINFSNILHSYQAVVVEYE